MRVVDATPDDVLTQHQRCSLHCSMPLAAFGLWPHLPPSVGVPVLLWHELFSKRRNPQRNRQLQLLHRRSGLERGFSAGCMPLPQPIACSSSALITPFCTHEVLTLARRVAPEVLLVILCQRPSPRQDSHPLAPCFAHCLLRPPIPASCAHSTFPHPVFTQACCPSESFERMGARVHLWECAPALHDAFRLGICR